MSRRRAVATGALAAAVAAGLGWAGATVFAPPPEALDTGSSAVATARAGEVGQTVAFTARVEWATETVIAGRAAGTVTSVIAASGQRVGAGDVLLTVDLRPVVVAHGTTPMFRPLVRGAEGPDVTQLQELLAGLGHYHGARDGRFGAGTRAAVLAWQRALGIRPDGVVRLGDLVFLPRLPAAIRLGDRMAAGAILTGGETLAEVLAPEPGFVIPLTDTQAARVQDGADVLVTRPGGGEWGARVEAHLPGDTGVDLRLGPREGRTAICGDGCGALDPGGETLLPATIVLVPPVRGVVVPSAAIAIRADGRMVVVDERGAEHPVELVASARGESVVTGIDAGARIRVPAP